MKKILVCPPRHYDTSFFLNPWLSYRESVDVELAQRQWEELVQALEDAGAEVEWLDPLPESPAMVFTADMALVYAQGKAIILRNDGVRSEYEVPAIRRWLAREGFISEGLPGRHTIDGGNVVRLSSHEYLVGLKPGSTGKAERYLARHLARFAGSTTRPLALHDRRFLHLDTVVGNLGGRALMVYWDGLLPVSRRYLRDRVSLPMITVDRADAELFACNSITVGDTVITGPVSDGLAGEIASHGLRPRRLDLSEFYKAGGGAKCLTLPLEYGVAATLSPERGGKDENRPVQGTCPSDDPG